MLSGKKIIVGISGGIAAYKMPLLIRLLKKAGAEVRVILTPSASAFVTPLTLATVSENPVLSAYFDEKTGVWANHVELGLWADLLLIAPATANTIARMASGASDNLLLATYLSVRCPVMVCPAMDLDMFAHPATRRNLSQLQADGCQVLPPEEGELASGLIGKGRLPEPETIFRAVTTRLLQQAEGPLSGKKVLITNGPTREHLDPVRFISNHSTGKMGCALADSFAMAGASVTIVSGPVQVQPEHPLVQVIPVVSAMEMYEQTLALFPQTDIAAFVAAVADFSPAVRAERKMKKEEGAEQLSVILRKNPDIAAEMGRIKGAHQRLIGFALETDRELENAQKKLKAKNLDMVVMNSLNDAGAGFGHDTNRVAMIDHHGVFFTETKSKKQIAVEIVNRLLGLMNLSENPTITR